MKLKSAGSSARTYTQSARAESARQTGQRIIDAFLGRLMGEWFDEITLDRIAQDAGVTVQTIVRRFGGKEGLLGSAIEILAVRIHAQRAMPSGDVDSLVENLFADYETTGDAVIRMLALEPRHPGIRPFTETGRREHRQWVSNVLAERLNKLEPAARRAAVDALVLVTDVYSWKLLRRDVGRSLPAAITITKSLVHATIVHFMDTNRKGE